ncbi:MAG: sensor histidine kinase [Anaeromyxobacter sp.]
MARLPADHRNVLPDLRRAEGARLQREMELVGGSPIVAAVLEVSDAILLVLNAERQIVAFNSRVPGVSRRDLCGLRPGEALDCVNAAGPGGCGAAPGCATCGALGAILVSQGTGRPVEAECSIRSQDATAAHEFNARAAPVVVEGHTFTVLSLRDISAEKRRQVLEQIFFHDVFNTVTALRNWSVLLQRAPDPRRPAERLEALSRQLERELRHQRALSEAERGTLQPQWEELSAGEVLEEVRGACAEHPLAQQRPLDLEPPPAGLALVSDRCLLARVLLNGVVNALEAAPPGGRVWLRARAEDGGAVFEIGNEGVLAPDVRARIFQRSFSTKAARGRGLGTYAMKLLGEAYLGGRVSFLSTAEAGTVFTVELPGRPG